MKSSLKKSSTPRSGKRKRRAISPIAIDQTSPTSKAKNSKRNLNVSEKTEKGEASTQGNNFLNLPYNDSEDEEEQGADLENQFVVGHEDLPSPTPKEDQGEQVVEASSRKPRS